MLPSPHRGKCLLCISYFWTLGSVLVTCFAWLFLDRYGWKYLIYIATIPSVLAVILTAIYLPESPRWLVTKGRISDAEDVLRKCADVNGNALMPFELIEYLVPSTHVEVQSNIGTGGLIVSSTTPSDTKLYSFMYFISKNHFKTNSLLWIAWFCFGFNYVGIILLVTDIFTSESDSNEESSQCTFEYSSLFINSFSECIGLSIALCIIDSVGRIKSQLVGYTITGGMMLLIGYVYIYHRSYAPLLTITFLTRMFIFGSSTITFESTPELLPTELRTTGHAICSCMQRFGAFLGPLVININIQNKKISGSNNHIMTTCFLLFLINTAGMIAVGYLPETTGILM
jgi:hypothetical protein